MTTKVTDLDPESYDITPLIETEVMEAGAVKLVRATVTVGPMTVTSFSDMIQEVADVPFQTYALQASNRAMELILKGPQA